MDSVKNLMIIAVLAAVGYGVYVSLSRENVDPGQPPGIAKEWPVVPRVELSGAKASPSHGGPLPLSGTFARPVGAADHGTGDTPPLSAPPLAVDPTPSSNPTATLGAPISPDAIVPAADPTPPPEDRLPPANAVRNLGPPPDALTAADVAPSAASPTDELLQSKFAAFMDVVRKKLDEGKLAEAHLALSTLYGNPDLPAEQAGQITALLDQLAGTVIYSRQHYLEPAYVTRQGETIEKIARQYNVPWQLLARINGLMPSGASNTDDATKDQPLPAGMELKVVRGPFDAVVRLDRRELTLMVQNRYAGRFPIGVGRDQPKFDGEHTEYTVCNKTLNPTYYGPDGVTIDPDDPKNPLGGAWIGLTDRIGIHGTSDPQDVGRGGNRGAICVGQRDLQDIYGILSVGSRVTILR